MTGQQTGGSGLTVPAKEYTVKPAKPEGFVVENVQWERLHKRVEELESQPSVNWLSTAAWSTFSIGASAVLAVLVLPDSEGTTLGDSVAPVLWILAAACAVLSAICTGLYFRMKKMRSTTASDICHEMDTIQQGALGDRE